MKSLLSGIKPTGHIHIGNYLGTVKNWVELQDKYNCHFFLADLHALTIDISSEELKQQSFDLAVDLLSLGIDPKKSIFFKQSDVVGHAELAWIFNCLTPVSELERMTQFKDESAKQPENVNAGLLTYPALQAADILLYLADNVPVGQDQIQHLELTRVVARKFNKRYQEFFPEVKPVLSPTPKVMALNNPIKKMSKSMGPASYVAIRDDRKTVVKKIKKAVTNEQGIKNLLELYSYFGDEKKHKEMLKDHKAGKLMNVKLKEELTTSIINFLEPVQKKIKDYEKNPAKVQKILDDGAKKAQKIATKNMAEIRKIVGIR
ncbi:tryptophan--tRNA ligase [Candidatus Parcubacteria bacterium]|nr:MAG: tryptophan--tRNA ligase [Candidatus Parcubacteria bacterium]